jgi:sugar (pentulose or hexulose) kinase
MDGMYSMERRSGQRIREIYVAGGGSQSDEICQITANMFGLPVIRIQTHEASGLGASVAGFVALGEFKSYEEAISHMVHIKDRFYPDMEEHCTYEKLYKYVYKRIYPRLLPLYIKIKHLTRREAV